jgi:hypothetical protein
VTPYNTDALHPQDTLLFDAREPDECRVRFTLPDEFNGDDVLVLHVTGADYRVVSSTRCLSAVTVLAHADAWSRAAAFIEDNKLNPRP